MSRSCIFLNSSDELAGIFLRVVEAFLARGLRTFCAFLKNKLTADLTSSGSSG